MWKLLRINLKPSSQEKKKTWNNIWWGVINSIHFHHDVHKYYAVRLKLLFVTVNYTSIKKTNNLQYKTEFSKAIWLLCKYMRFLQKNLKYSNTIFYVTHNSNSAYSNCNVIKPWLLGYCVEEISTPQKKSHTDHVPNHRPNSSLSNNLPLNVASKNLSISCFWADGFGDYPNMIERFQSFGKQTLTILSPEV